LKVVGLRRKAVPKTGEEKNERRRTRTNAQPALGENWTRGSLRHEGKNAQGIGISTGRGKLEDM